MRVLVQRVTHGSVSVEGETIGEIGRGVVLLTGIAPDDDNLTVRRMAAKIVKLRIFPDERGRFDRSLLDVGGGALVVSQFTLFGDTRKGNRPSFTAAAPPEHAEPLCRAFEQALRDAGVERVEAGRFGADMAVTIHNDGPVTLWLDSRNF